MWFGFQDVGDSGSENEGDKSDREEEEEAASGETKKVNSFFSNPLI